MNPTKVENEKYLLKHLDEHGDFLEYLDLSGNIPISKLNILTYSAMQALRVLVNEHYYNIFDCDNGSDEILEA